MVFPRLVTHAQSTQVHRAYISSHVRMSESLRSEARSSFLHEWYGLHYYIWARSAYRLAILKCVGIRRGSGEEWNGSINS